LRGAAVLAPCLLARLFFEAILLSISAHS